MTIEIKVVVSTSPHPDVRSILVSEKGLKDGSFLRGSHLVAFFLLVEAFHPVCQFIRRVISLQANRKPSDIRLKAQEEHQPGLIRSSASLMDLFLSTSFRFLVNIVHIYTNSFSSAPTGNMSNAEC